MILLSATSGSTLATVPSDDLLVATTEGLARFRRQEGAWNPAGHWLDGVSITGLTVTASGRMLASTHGLGVYVSDDHGRSWSLSNNGLGQYDLWSIKAVRLHSRELVFAGSLPAHLWVSEDDGRTWRDCAGLRDVATAPQWMFPVPPHVAHVLDIASLGDSLLVGVEVGALLRSDDISETFRELPVNSEVSEVDIHRIAVHPARPDRIIISTGWGVQISEDRGETWHASGELPGIHYPVPLVMHPEDPDLLFVAGGEGWPPNWYKIGRSRAKIARSRDGGMSWERLLGGLPDGQRPCWGGLALEAWPGGFAVYAADTDGAIYESVDGGDRWNVIGEAGPVAKGDQHKGLAKGRTHLVGVDDLLFVGPGKDRVTSVPGGTTP